MKNEKGITFVELLAAVVIMGMIIVPLLTIMTGTATRTASQERETSNAYIAQDVMESVMINVGGFKIDRNDDGTERTYCASEITGTCPAGSDFPVALKAEIELMVNEYEIVEAFVKPYSENHLFNEVRIVVRNDDQIAYGPSGGTIDKENRIELVTVVKR